MGAETSDKPEEAPEPITWVDFLQGQPPGSVLLVTGSSWQDRDGKYYASMPELQLYCPEHTCNAYMFFEGAGDWVRLALNKWEHGYFEYRCRNCQAYSKTFALHLRLITAKVAEAYKFGEFPAFGPPVPPRVLRLIEPDRDLFLSGRRCENQGLGIGAFAYYRRVVENQWSRLVDEIIRVARKIDAPEETIEALERSRDEKQFARAVKSLKGAIPPVLLINGHNPLVLLHEGLSQGVHKLRDEECLNLATVIRVVLVELAEKLGQALKDEKELTDALSRLLNAHAAKKAEENTRDNGLEPIS